MGKIFLASSDIYTAFGILDINADHLFLVHDQDGNISTTSDQYIIEASPTFSVGGTLVATIDVPLTNSTYSSSSDPAVEFKYKEIHSGSNSDEYWNNLKNIATELAPYDGTYFSTGLDYWLQGPNSNTFINSVLSIAGENLYENEPAGVHPGVQGVFDGVGDDEITINNNPYGNTIYIDKNDNDNDIIKLKKDATLVIERNEGDVTTGAGGGGGGITLEIEGVDSNDIKVIRRGDDALVVDVSSPANPKPLVYIKDQHNPDKGPAVKTITVTSDDNGIGGGGGPIDLSGGGPLPELSDAQKDFLIDLADWFNKIYDDFFDWMNLASPLILDLGDNNAIDLTSVASSTAFFDINGNGFSTRTGWIDSTSGDGFLVWDKNSDGVINDITELFGNAEEEGFIELTLLDSNADGVIDSSDTEWSSLQIWVDANGDGYSEASELFTLADQNIASITLANTRIDQSVNGNLITNESTFTYTDASTGKIVDAWFDYSSANTLYTDNYNADMRVYFLPDMRGYGEVADLNIAMSLDNGTGGLLDMVSDLVTSQNLSDLMTSTTLHDDMRAIMHRWAGVDGVSWTSRGEYVNARDLEFLEQFTGQPFRQHGYREDPLRDAGNALTDTFNDALNAIMARVLLQAGGADLFSNAITYDLATDSFTDPGAIDGAALSALEALATNAVDALPIWENVVRLVIGARGSELDLTAADITALDTAITNSDATLDFDAVRDSIFPSSVDGVTTNGDASDNAISGTTDNDALDGRDGYDTLDGGAGFDTLDGGDDNDTLTGGLDDDLIFGGRGNDTYVYNLGDGQDVYRELSPSETSDKILFGVGITLADLTFTRLSNEDMQIDIAVPGNEGVIIIEKQFDPSSATGSIETLEFSDASTFDLTAVDYTLNGSSGKDTLLGVDNGGGGQNDTIYGLGGNDQISGYDGVDILYGGNGDDTIHGASIYGHHYDETDSNTLYGEGGNDYLAGSYGTDHLTGGVGNDTTKGRKGDDHYYYNLGDGNDLIEEQTQAEVNDILHLGAGIAAVDLSYMREGQYDLKLLINNGVDGNITFKGQFGTGAADGAVDYIELDDATLIDLSALSYTLHGTSAAETLYGTKINSSGADTIYGGNGADTIYASATGGTSDYDETATNTLYGEAGADTLWGSYGVDHLTGGTENDVLNGRRGDDHYYFNLGDGDDVITEQLQTEHNDILHFGAGIAAADLSYARIGQYDLKVLVNNGTDGSITFIDQFRDGSSYGAVDLIELDDATLVDLGALDYTLHGTSANETLYGTKINSTGADTIYGGAGNDTIYSSHSTSSSGYSETVSNWLYGEAGDDDLFGSYGTDYLTGGTEDDTLKGRRGDDHYYFELNDGDDVIEEERSDGIDTLHLGSGIVAADLSYERVGTKDLKILINGGAGGSITLEDQFGTSSSDGAVEYIELADMTQIDLTAQGYTLYGTASNNTLYGVRTNSNGEDTIYGGDGNDTIYGSGSSSSSTYNETASGFLYGENGNDTVRGSYGDDLLSGGDGSDTLTGRLGADTFVFNAGETGIDTITDFETSENDVLDLSDLLDLYDPLVDVLTDFVEITDSGSDSIVKVDTDGSANGTNFVQIATLDGITGLTDEVLLETNGNIFV